MFFISRYYAIVTVTTVGYGDITPRTKAGRYATTYYIISVMLWVPSKVVYHGISELQVSRLMDTPPSPKDHFTKKGLTRRHNAEHVVIIGYYKEFLKRLLSEMKEDSSDCLKDTICNE